MMGTRIISKNGRLSIQKLLCRECGIYVRAEYNVVEDYVQST